MKTIIVGGAAIAMLALYFQADNIFDSDDNDPDAHKARVSIAIDGDSKDVARVTGDTDAAGDTDVAIVASSDPGKLAIKLPGGFEAKMPMPDGITDDNKFDIDGVGLYPGATVDTINVNADKRDDASGDKAVVVIGFAAPASAETVAGWYEGQFRAKNIAVRRKGTLLTGKTEDGNDFALLLSDIAGGKARGQLTIHDRK
jgi:hypothetical protein